MVRAPCAPIGAILASSSFCPAAVPTAPRDRRTDGGRIVTSQTRTTHDRIGRAIAGSVTGVLLCVAGGLVAAAPAAAAPVPRSVTFTAVGETAFRVPAGVTS